MSDATARGGAQQAFYHTQKTKEGGVIRVDREEVLKAVQKAALYKGNGRNQPMAKAIGPEKPVNTKKKGY